MLQAVCFELKFFFNSGIRLINDELDLALILIEELSDDVRADALALMHPKVAVIGGRVGVSQFGTH